MKKIFESKDLSVNQVIINMVNGWKEIYPDLKVDVFCYKNNEETIDERSQMFFQKGDFIFRKLGDTKPRGIESFMTSCGYVKIEFNLPNIVKHTFYVKQEEKTSLYSEKPQSN